jgi:hypothetical protein
MYVPSGTQAPSKHQSRIKFLASMYLPYVFLISLKNNSEMRSARVCRPHRQSRVFMTRRYDIIIVTGNPMFRI